jgi:hypothetical protein
VGRPRNYSFSKLGYLRTEWHHWQLCSHLYYYPENLVTGYVLNVNWDDHKNACKQYPLMLCDFKLEYFEKFLMALTKNTELLTSCYIRTDRDMTKLWGAFCVFQTLLPYLDLPDSTVYNKVENNVFRASAFSHHSEEKKRNRKNAPFRKERDFHLSILSTNRSLINVLNSVRMLCKTSLLTESQIFL